MTSGGVPRTNLQSPADVDPLTGSLNVIVIVSAAVSAAVNVGRTPSEAYVTVCVSGVLSVAPEKAFGGSAASVTVAGMLIVYIVDAVAVPVKARPTSRPVWVAVIVPSVGETVIRESVASASGSLTRNASSEDVGNDAEPEVNVGAYESS